MFNDFRSFAFKFLGLFGTNQTQLLGPTIKETLNLNEVKDNDGQAPKCDKQYGKAIDASSKQIVGLLLEKGIPGLTICVAKQGHVVWHSAFGFCDVENQLECLPEARMRIASISKPLFVSTVIGPLLDKQEIDLDWSIYKFLNEQEFPKQKYNNKEVDITIEQLLSHTSGVRHYDEGKETTKPLRPIGSKGSKKIYQCDDQFNRIGFFQRKTFRNVIDALETFKDQTILNEPGTKFKYTTQGYTLLSAVIEKIINTAQQKTTNVINDGGDKKQDKIQIEDFWMNTLRRDWKLKETSLDQDELILPNRAKYYLRTGEYGNLINAPYADNSVKWAGGGIVSTTRDLIKFGNALIDSYKSKQSAMLKRETIELLWKEVKSSYGLGFQLHKLESTDDAGGGKEKVAIYHLGGALGASSALLIYPESEIVVAILSNLNHVNLLPLSLFIADKFAIY